MLRLTAALLAVAFVSVGSLTGCGGGDEATEKTTTQAIPASQVRELRPLEVKARDYMKRKFADEKWYPFVENVYIGTETAAGAATVRTFLYGHKNARRNERFAEEICKAVVSTPYVDRAGVFYDDVRGGSTAQCFS